MNSKHQLIWTEEEVNEIAPGTYLCLDDDDTKKTYYTTSVYFPGEKDTKWRSKKIYTGKLVSAQVTYKVSDGKQIWYYCVSARDCLRNTHDIGYSQEGFKTRTEAEAAATKYIFDKKWENAYET